MTSLGRLALRRLIAYMLVAWKERLSANPRGWCTLKITFSWNLRCIDSLPACLKDLLQFGKSHLKGFCPVWMYVCSFKYCKSAKLLKQSTQTCCF